MFEIEGEEKKEEADGLVGDPLTEAAGPGMLLKIIFGIDADAMIADDPFKVRLDESGEFVVAHVHVELHAGVGADPVYIIRSIGHPDTVVGGHFAMEDGSLILIDMNFVGEQPAVHILFCEAGDPDVGDGADDDADVDAAFCSPYHFFPEKGSGEEIGGENDDVGVGLAEHFEVAAGDLIFSLDPIVAANADETFLVGGYSGEAGEVVALRFVNAPVGCGPHVTAGDVQFERSLAFDMECAVEPGGLAGYIVVAVADVDAPCDAVGGVGDDDFVVHAAAEIKIAAFEEGPEPAEADAGGFPFADELAGQVLGRVAVEEDEDADFPRCRAEEGGGDEPAGFVAVEDIGLEVERVFGVVD